MNTYLVMPEGSKWFTVEAYTIESAYGLVGHWFRPSTRVAIRDINGSVTIFTRKIDRDGNLLEVVKGVI